ncbi:TRM1 tRNA methyltransferase 1, putative [Ichthyophthirius multifiliis]|uniref:tRNA (guanine(26)-N(2))-dimethyltransferase n=1 Tax=Ichthyophthirius multifiliis TaxID=5932 RepID=G0QZ05_ICHMU|nr:TRM1 tRNA methyltransferase 1, putative [Ichthyophthirius multifiliis]EGR29576.1 TRM1 tRNA methyltransferase 1, putative [Ichthyophthirius multifiliis]|eukprot:XP_004030812.1 TRM1 tRNA methyltransferase 1, putative [Ichthyophthirius multifiliis]
MKVKPKLKNHIQNRKEQKQYKPKYFTIQFKQKLQKNEQKQNKKGVQQRFNSINNTYVYINAEGKTQKKRDFQNKKNNNKEGQNFEGINILDALSASGLRTIRFLKELKNINKIYANDISDASHKLMMENFILNELDLSKIEMTQKDAIQLLYEHRFRLNKGDLSAKLHVIDLDPYGTAVPFLDCALQAACFDTLLCVTSTDSRILCGQDTQKCYYLYGSSRAKMQAFQENAIRILLYTLNNTANKYSKHIVPLICYLSEFYVRCFILVKNGKQECGKSILKTGNIFNCDNCGNFYTQPFGKSLKNEKLERFAPTNLNIPSNKCDQCGNNFTINGPVWIDKLNDEDFVNKTIQFLNQQQCQLKLQTKEKINGMLHAITLEQQIQLDQIPYGFSIEHISKYLKTTIPSKKKIYSAYMSLGYNIEQSYLNPIIFKTNASSEIVFDIMRNWVFFEFLQIYIKQFIFYFIFEKKEKYIIKRTNPNFDLNIKIDKAIPKWIPNPEKNWGPGKRAIAKKIIDDGIQEEKVDQLLIENQDILYDKLQKKNKQD